MRKWLAVTIIILVLCPVAFAAIIEPPKEEPTEKPTIEPTNPPVITEPNELTTTKIVITSNTPVAASLLEKSTTKEAVLQQATEKIFAEEKYPLQIASEVTINHYRCEKEKCGYWITATREGKEVAVNNPIWLVNGNAPYHTVVSNVYDAKSNTETITMKEDVKGAVFQILTEYADRQPIGKAVTGTKE